MSCLIRIYFHKRRAESSQCICISNPHYSHICLQQINHFDFKVNYGFKNLCSVKKGNDVE